MGISAMIQTGGLVLPRSAPRMAEFVSEVVPFSNGKHDDQVDALSQLMTWVRRADAVRPEPIAEPEAMTTYGPTTSLEEGIDAVIEAWGRD